MSPQGVTRKRPAPGTSPLPHPPQPQMGPIPNFPQSAGPQLSNDQFLQWGQNPSHVAHSQPFPDPTAYNNAAYAPTQDIPAPSTQLARRQAPAAVPTRGARYESPSTTTENGNHSGDPGPWGESLEHLYQRAVVAKRDAQAKRKQIPPFVQKLSSFLDESKNTELIRWADDGNSFIVLDEDEFAKTLIPELFKHNNYASFVRQLNMYGFHKKVGLSDNSMRASERKNKSPSEYANPYFRRGHPDLLWLISKPKNSGGQANRPAKPPVRVKTEDADPDDDDTDEAAGLHHERVRGRQLSLITNNDVAKDQLSGVYRELQAIRQQQQIISTTITKLRREHEQLYAQAANFQEQHSRHENSINAILTFLATVYNRSLQGQDGGPQNLANSFAGAISQDAGNIVDVGDDYSLSTLGASNLAGPAAAAAAAARAAPKKQPLLLKAPPAPGSNRATTLSPAASAYDRPPPRAPSRHQPTAPQTGQVEEVFDASPRPKAPLPPDTTTQGAAPQRDIMSVIENSNARNGLPTSLADFPHVLSSLENSGGNVPLTPNQRADMLRLMAHESHPGGDDVPLSQNNALMTPTPPPMPHNYSGRLADTRAEIDNLVKMQAEQDRSVQNLTNLLQPLSPTGAIPGLGADGSVPPPPLDLDQIFSNDYFTDLQDADPHNKSNLEYGDPASGAHTSLPEPPVHSGPDDSGLKDAHDLFNFDHVPADDDPFGAHATPNPSYYGGYDGSNGYGAPSGLGPNPGPVPDDSGRIIETLTDSEGTSPANTVEEVPTYGEDSQPPGSESKRRKKA
ncbi:hypothetical protein BDW42DRAFT_202122 [Aspergillus taichungensis]|uniref:HSF-type DNA-binding domain-containing protein n=1 Tax=Aspergillus taichungensis TaxID=482145 RepID=A0A2J5HMX2_9EURO|nr:hypothetical protein BDW42DRAFT_202122 [Aspergillus taichungensis]